jgi:hypothetical protein
MTRTLLGLAAAGALVLSGTAWGHHSNAHFDQTKEIKLTGKVVEFHLINPHSYIYLDVRGEDGQQYEWALETGGGVGRLIRANWRQDSMKPGDTITITAHPLKDGTTGALLVDVTLADGTKLGAPI